MTDVAAEDDLYREAVLDHGRAPRNRSPLPTATNRGEEVNPFCGDRVTIFLEIVADRVERTTFECAGCTLLTASASILTEAVTSRSPQEARDFAERLERALETGVDPGLPSEATALLGAHRFPARRDCILLPWRALHEALSRATE